LAQNEWVNNDDGPTIQRAKASDGGKKIEKCTSGDCGIVFDG
jgi:hypothetical protein